MSTPVLAPLAGRLLPLSEVPDPVFAAEMVGPGVAIDPPEGDAPVTVVSPIAGTLLKLHPHAFIVLGPEGVGILVHLGIDTVRLDGRGFELHGVEGGTVAAGDPMVTWDLSVTRAEGLSPVVPVVAMDRPRARSPHRTEGSSRRATCCTRWQGDRMIFIAARFRVLAEHADAWPEITRSFTEATRAEPGNLWFDWSRDLDDPQEYVLSRRSRTTPPVRTSSPTTSSRRGPSSRSTWRRRPASSTRPSRAPSGTSSGSWLSIAERRDAVRTK